MRLEIRRNCQPYRVEYIFGTYYVGTVVHPAVRRGHYQRAIENQRASIVLIRSQKDRQMREKKRPVVHVTKVAISVCTKVAGFSMRCLISRGW